MSAQRSMKLPKDHLFPKGFWKRPDIKTRKTGDPSDTEIYRAVGIALTAWESMEELFAMLFLILTQAKDGNVAMAVLRAFGSIENTGGRIKAMRAVAPIYFSNYWHLSEVKAPLNALMKEIGLGSHLRNEIAHGKVIHIHANDMDDAGNNRTRDLGCLLVAPEYITGHTDPYMDLSDGDLRVRPESS